MAERIGILGGRLCTLCAALFCAVILVQNVITILSGQPLVVVLALAVAAAVVVLCMRFLPAIRGFAAVLFLVRFALALFFILWLGSQPVQDFDTMYSAAVQLAQGSHDYLNDVYFYNWAYQSAFVAYEALVVRLFGPTLFPLQLLNALYLAGTTVLVYLIASRFLPRRAAMAAGVLYTIYPAPLFLAGVLTNQHLAAFLLYLAVYLLVSGQTLTPLRAAGAGVLIALGNAMRPIGIILVLATVLWALMRALRRAGRERVLPALLPAALTAAGYALASVLLSGLIIVTGVNPEGLTNNQPLWKFVVGLNQESSGSWNQSDYDTYLSLPPEEAGQAMAQAVQERLKAGPVDLAGLAWRKSAVMWGANEDLFWGFGHLDQEAPAITFPVTLTWGTLQRLLIYCDKGVYFLTFCLAMLGILGRLRRPERCGPSLLLILTFCGYYAVHLIVEVQSRYRYFLMPCVVLLAGLCLSRLLPDGEEEERLPE